MDELDQIEQSLNQGNQNMDMSPEDMLRQELSQIPPRKTRSHTIFARNHQYCCPIRGKWSYRGRNSTIFGWNRLNYWRIRDGWELIDGRRSAWNEYGHDVMGFF